MDIEQIRQDFEEWFSEGGLSQRALERNSVGNYRLMQAASAWEVWKAAHTHYAKSAAPAEDGEQLATGGQPQADAQDAERLDFLTRKIGGAAFRKIGVEWAEHADARRAIDAAIAAAKGE